MQLRPYSATVLALGGTILMTLGPYFVFLRPPLLPEDARFMGTSLVELQATVRGLLIWLRRVFSGMGGFMFATGLLTFYVAVTTFRTRVRGVAGAVALAGLTSIGLMAVVNFIIGSDFKWLILSFALPWTLDLGPWTLDLGPGTLLVRTERLMKRDRHLSGPREQACRRPHVTALTRRHMYP